MAADPRTTIARTKGPRLNSADSHGRIRRVARELIALARPWQWVKNSVVLAALVFSHGLLRPRDAIVAAIACAAFCALSSFAYVLNDILDREADRLNPEKCDRPLACGELTVGAAVCFAIALGAIGTLLGVTLGLSFLQVGALYVALQFGYSLWARRRVVLDVVAVAIGFVLRAYAGAVAIGAEVSPWLVFIAFLLAMLLVLGKRRHELVAMGARAAAHRIVLAQYSLRLLDQMLAIVAGATLISYMIYTASAEVEAKLGTRYLYLTAPIVAFGILRYLYVVDTQNEGGDPTRMLIRDRPLALSVLLWSAAIVILLYG